MPLPFLQRWIASVLPVPSRQSRGESRPPVARPRWQGRPSKSEHLAEARLDFARALDDVGNDAATRALARIAVARSLHELWHFREEVFSLVACSHSQDEASRRLALLDSHFPRRARRSGFAPFWQG